MAEMTRETVKTMSVPDLIGLVSDVALLTENPALEGIGDRLFSMQHTLHEIARISRRELGSPITPPSEEP